MFKFREYFLGTIFLAVIGISSFFNFLFFHTIAELFSIVIAFCIFIVSWNTRFFSPNKYLLFLGIVYLFVGILDLTHTLAYKGMNIFHGYGANLPTQLWIGARYFESISLMIAPLFLTRQLHIPVTFMVYMGSCIMLLSSLFVWPVFPDCFIEGTGLTAFKKNSEYIISIILLVASITLYKKRTYFTKEIFILIITSFALTICSEIAFTYYVSVYGISNLVGHLFKIVSFYLIYRAVVVATLTTPLNSLFRELVQSEKTTKRALEKLENAFVRIKKLEGLLPVCMHCKKIRDDHGDWSQMEEYIQQRSDINFSHGCCPDCLTEYYPKVAEDMKKK